jgi:hypothetical protein
LATQIRIQDAGLHGTLRLRLVDDGLDHAVTDETSGTWTNLACPDHGLAIGNDVDPALLTELYGQREVADLIWEAPPSLSRRTHEEALRLATHGYTTVDLEMGELHWRNLETIWSQAWSANWDVLASMQERGLRRFSAVKPQRWVIASFEHHSGPHGVDLPYIHNIVVAPLTTSAVPEGHSGRGVHSKMDRNSLL